MTTFQILDKDGRPIPIGTLDKEVCILTGNEEDKRYYCRLGNRKDHKTEMDFIFSTHNWYDTIGWMIASMGYTLQELRDYYETPFKSILGKIDDNGDIITLEKIYPYHMKVIDFWIEKGYQTKQIKY